MTAVIAIAAQRTTSFVSRKLIVEIAGSVVAATIVALISGHLATETAPGRDAPAAASAQAPLQPYVPIIDPLTGKIADRLPGTQGRPEVQTAAMTVRRPLSSAMLFATPYREASTVWSTPAPVLAPPLDITAGIRTAAMAAPIASLPAGPSSVTRPGRGRSDVPLPPRDVPDALPRGVAMTPVDEQVRLADAAPGERGWLGRMMPGSIAHAGNALWHNGQSMIGHATSLGGGLVRHIVP